jgi:integrase
MGIKDDGTPDRPHVKRKTEKEVIERVRELERERDSGRVRKPGRAPLVETWLTEWVENIAPITVKYKGMAAYRTAVYKHLIPGLGAHHMDKIQPEHFEKLYAKMQRSGLKPATAHQVHRTARTAFGEARRRRVIVYDPFEVVKPPVIEDEEIEPFEPEDIRRLVVAALQRRNGVRFVIALALGFRQGEALGLRWSRLKESTKSLRVRKQLQRHVWQHGCDDPHECGAKWHKREPCKPGCKRHKTCPPPCRPNCERHGQHCPKRWGGGLVEVDVKSRAGRRTVVLPDHLFDLLMTHKAEQDREREHAGTVWQPGEWMFTQPDGKPIDPRRDLDEWKDLLAEVGLDEARLHDARHTAASSLLLLGISGRAAMDVMGWSDEAMLRRYQHVTEELRRDIASRIDGHLWHVTEATGDGDSQAN